MSQLSRIQGVYISNLYFIIYHGVTIYINFLYHLILVRKALVLVHTLIYLHSNIYFRNISLNFKVSCGSYLYKGTLTFILLPPLNYNLSGETSSAIHHFLSPFTQNVKIRVTLSPLYCDLSTLSVQILVTAPKVMFATVNIYCPRCIVDFCSTSRFYIYIVCVDRSGSLSGGAFNQLRLVTLNIVLTILY